MTADGGPLCRRCGHPVPTAAEVCGLCGTLVRRRSLPVTRPLGPPPEPAAEATTPDPDPDADVRPRRRAVLEMPWGDYAIDSGEEVDVGREVPPFGPRLEEYITISRRHAKLRLSPQGSLFVRDYSVNGTYVNGRRCERTGEVEVPDGAELGFSRAFSVRVRLTP